MRILVTGGSGFLGSGLVRLARAAGHRVARLSRHSAPDPTPDDLTGDMADPPWEAITRFAPEACVHAAWITTPGVYEESPENLRCRQASARLLRRLADSGTGRIVALGTCAEYGPTGHPLAEATAPIAPVSAYARAKVDLHRELEPLLGDRLVWARIFYPYGEGEHPDRLLSTVVRHLAAGRPVRIRTPDSVKDYIHADDVARALLRLVAAPVHGAVNVGTGIGVGVGELARNLAMILDREDLLEFPDAPAIDPLDHRVADPARLRALGWAPAVGLADGLRRLVEARLR